MAFYLCTQYTLYTSSWKSYTLHTDGTSGTQVRDKRARITNGSGLTSFHLQRHCWVQSKFIYPCAVDRPCQLKGPGFPGTCCCSWFSCSAMNRFSVSEVPGRSQGSVATELDPSSPTCFMMSSGSTSELSSSVLIGLF